MRITVKRNIAVFSIVMMLFGVLFVGSNTVYAAGGTSDEEAVSLIMTVTEASVKSSFGKNYSIYKKGNMVTLNLWQDGVAAGAYGVAAGLVDKKEWDNMTETIRTSIATVLYDALEPYGVHANVNILNDYNTDNVLVSYLDGVKVYDALE
ncbi:hypothetical protein D6855_14750 [Butyrivibrio sp. CB08]|uniref:hypothetical protein n=1 Tax=Butyrivibrio sp. CB08 TaxID=2364879 RepID=UPI000EA9F670|nr:hypothetical protein [Butyrivibrio sp. CB08]RKM56118.1 hypothetical protein D6855_14750 [Butyrivibrio sp. CB08]